MFLVDTLAMFVIDTAYCIQNTEVMYEWIFAYSAVSFGG